MSNSATIDRRDVAHPTNPIGGQGYVEQINKSSISVLPGDTRPGRVDELNVDGPKPASPHSLRSAH